MKNSSHLSYLRALISERIANNQPFTSALLLDKLREFARKRGENVHQKTLEETVVGIYNQGLMSNYQMTLGGSNVIFTPRRKTSEARTMNQDSLGRVTVPTSIIRALGVDAYGEIYVTREPNRILLTNQPLGSDSTAVAVDCYANTKLHLPRTSSKWVAQNINNQVVEVVAASA